MKDTPSGDAEQAARKAQTKAARQASRRVPHIANLVAPVTLYRCVGKGWSKEAQRWKADLSKLPTVAGIQKKYGEGRWLLVDKTGARFVFNLDAPPEPEPEPEPEPGAAPADDWEPHPQRPQPEPLFDAQTGRPLYRSDHPPAGPRAYPFDPYTGRPMLHAAPYAATNPHHTGPYQPAPYHAPHLRHAPPAQAPPLPAAPAPNGDVAMLRYMFDQLREEMRAIRAQQAQRPMAPANDFGGQVEDMLKAKQLFDMMRESFGGGGYEDEDDEDGWMGMLKSILPNLLPQVGGAPVVGGPPQPNPGSPGQAEAAAQHWAQKPLTAQEVQGARMMLSQLSSWAPELTLESLCAMGAEAQISPRQSIYLLHKVLNMLNASGAVVDDDWSDEESEEEDEAPAGGETAWQPEPNPEPEPTPPTTTPGTSPAQH